MSRERKFADVGNDVMRCDCVAVGRCADPDCTCGHVIVQLSTENVAFAIAYMPPAVARNVAADLLEFADEAEAQALGGDGRLN